MHYPDPDWDTHPVDSGTHPCCRSIGGHARDCRDGAAAIFAAAEHERASTPTAAVEHSTTVVPATISGRGYRAACYTCGWTSPGCVTEHAAREHAAGHYLASGGGADDDSRELVASMRRHPASQGGTR